MTLKEYMDANHLNCPAFVKMLDDVGYTASRYTVQSWRLGQRPKVDAWPYIQRATGDKVKPASFLHHPAKVK